MFLSHLKQRDRSCCLGGGWHYQVPEKFTKRSCKQFPYGVVMRWQLRPQKCRNCDTRRRGETRAQGVKLPSQ